MAQEFKLPDLGEGIHEAQIINIMIHEGDTVREDQMVMEVETDKAAVEIPVPFGGRVAKVFVSTGQTVKVGQPLLAVETAGGRAAAPTAAPRAAAESGPPAPASRAPATPPREPAPRPVLAAAPPRGTSEAAASTATARPGEPTERRGPIPAAPAIRRQAREMNIDLGQVRGTGPGGRIVREDLERFAITGPTAAGSGAARGEMNIGTLESAEPLAIESPRAALSAEPLPDFAQWGSIRREAISQIRKTIARQMVRSYALIPHVTHCDHADVTDLESFRKQHGEVFKEPGARLTLTTFVVKAVAGALQQFPNLKCSFDEARSEIIYKDYTHIGIAVDTPRGLVVPVLRDCDRKGLMKVAQELADVAERARSAKFEIAELRGGTFTITNVGPVGGSFVTPMINYPEVAILGLGRLGWQPVVRDGQIVPRMILPLSLSFDHRVIDGADAARFVRAVIAYLESPLNLLLVS